jgi:molecular chaperone GrpE
MSQKNNNSKDNEKSEFIDIDYQIDEADSGPSNSSKEVELLEPHSNAQSAGNEFIEEIKGLYKQIEEKDSQYEKVHSQYLRALADYENLNKRTKSEKKRILKQANEKILLKLIDLADTFEKAEKELTNPDSLTLEKAIDGFKAVHKQFSTILKNEGVEKISSLGEKFDPNFHEVIFVKPDSNNEEDIILEEIQVGYILNSELLRPVKVVVSKKITEKSDKK